MSDFYARLTAGICHVCCEVSKTRPASVVKRGLRRRARAEVRRVLRRTGEL